VRTEAARDKPAMVVADRDAAIVARVA